MKVLVVEYIAPIEHSGYVSHHIECLKRLGHSITFYTHKKFFESCNITDIGFKFFPSVLHCRTNNPYKPILERIQGIIKLIYLDILLLFQKYDVIIFTSYDIMSFWSFKSSTKTFIVNHNNLTDFSSPIKRFLHNRLPKHYIHVALAPFIADYLRERVKQDVIVVPHGMTKIYPRVDESERTLYGGRYVYVPTTSSCDKRLLSSIIDSDSVHKYLYDTKTVLVIKSPTLQTSSDSIIIIRGYIDNDHYSRIMSESFAVFAPYSDSSFHYRVSAVLMECFGSNIPILSTKTQSYESYANLCNYDFIIDSPQSFVHCLQIIDSINDENYYKDLDSLLPSSYWNLALNK